MKLSIIVPTRDRGDIFEQTLKSLCNSARELESEIIVVNDSTIGNPVVPDGVRILQNNGRGVAAARNLGATAARAENLLFVDDDMLVGPEHLTKALELLGQDPWRVVLFNWEYPSDLKKKLRAAWFGRYLERFGFTSLRGWLKDEWNNGVFELSGGASYFLPIRKETFNAIGGYREQFTHAGAEDYDFVRRARKAGLRFFLDPGQTIYHNERDRLDMTGFLQRKKRNAETIAIAVGLGYKELAVEYQGVKQAALKGLSILKPLIEVVTRMLPGHSVFDAIHFRLMNTLLAIYFFEGYTKVRP